ncbi:hypothetical protein GCM10011391_14030 [Pullulanibacillus camelliae]|uniref:Uncharacterized protein n=1 Tax=Pullulanibacillus camelliae TaxID=1707096 RepID=A0A8J2VRN9_9BACL|nr:hypothetical protein GCM10011391_14030 [Pullulanibacillus camelliae]
MIVAQKSSQLSVYIKQSLPKRRIIRQCHCGKLEEFDTIRQEGYQIHALTERFLSTKTLLVLL